MNCNTSSASSFSGTLATSSRKGKKTREKTLGRDWPKAAIICIHDRTSAFLTSLFCSLSTLK
jgi:hypothetical protein